MHLLSKYKIEENKKGANINYRLSAKLIVKPPTKDTMVYATSNGEDPWDSKSQRSEIKTETTLDVNGGNKMIPLDNRRQGRQLEQGNRNQLH